MTKALFFVAAAFIVNAKAFGDTTNHVVHFKCRSSSYDATITIDLNTRNWTFSGDRQHCSVPAGTMMVLNGILYLPEDSSDLCAIQDDLGYPFDGKVTGYGVELYYHTTNGIINSFEIQESGDDCKGEIDGQFGKSVQ